MAEQLLAAQEELTFMDLLNHKSGRLRRAGKVETGRLLNKNLLV
jgi:hypothetical protein